MAVNYHGKFFLNIGPRDYLIGMYHYTVDLLFDWFGFSCMTTENICIYLLNRLIQTNQTGGQWYSDTSPLVFPVLTLSTPLTFTERREYFKTKIYYFKDFKIVITFLHC
jgi:hypothetical protein